MKGDFTSEHEGIVGETAREYIKRLDREAQQRQQFQGSTMTETLTFDPPPGLPHFSAAETKATNPKDAVGVRKVPLHVVPPRVVAEMGLALLEGARKYGSYNWRAAGVRASVYFDATRRHLDDWWEGVDIDADSGLSHVTKAIASLVVLRDSMMHQNWVDDRPVASEPGWVQEMNTKAGEIIDRLPVAKAPFTQKSS